MDEQPAEQEVYSLGEWLGRLSQGRGLRDLNIRDKMGGGLLRLLHAEDMEPSEVTETAVTFFDELLSKIENREHQIVGLVTLNTADWQETRDKLLVARQKWLANHDQKWSRSLSQRKPVVPYETTRTHMREKVFPYLTQAILARWSKKFPNEPFPLEARPQRRKIRKTSYLRALDSTITYVRRPEAEAELLAWLKSEDQFAVVTGDSGTGKSRLVSQVLSEFGSQNQIQLVVLDAATPYLLFDTMCNYLERTPAVGDAAKVKFDFLLTLRRVARTTVVLIDNVPDWESIEEVVAAAPRCVITTESDLIPAGQSHFRIEVDGLTLKEGASLVHSLRPDSGEDPEVARLWYAVAGKPQLLVDVLGMGENMTIAEICDCFDSDSSRIPQIVGKGTRSVEKQYRRYYDQIRSNNQPAALFLDVIVHLDQSVVSLEIASRVWARAAHAVGIRISSPASEAKLLAIMIKQRSLFDFDDGYIVSHQLTRRIFRSIGYTYKDAIFQALFGCYLDQLTVVESEDVLARESLEWVPVVGSALITLSIEEILAKLSIPIALEAMIETVCVGYSQFGEFLSSIAVLRRFINDQNYANSKASSWFNLQYVRKMFQLGALNRTEYAAWLEISANAIDAAYSAESLGLRLMMLWDAARARYEYEEAYLESEPHVRWALEHESEEKQRAGSLFEIMYLNVRSFEQLGYIVEAMQGYVGYAHDNGGGMSTILRLRAAADGCRASSRHWLSSWCDKALKIARECHNQIIGKTDVLQADAFYTLAQAWRCRLNASNSMESVTQAVELFSNAGDLFVASGQIRTALDAYVESIALMYWERATARGASNVPGFDDPGYFLLYVYRLAEQVDEPHVMYRLGLLSKLQKGLSRGVDIEEIDYLLRIGEKSVASCQDFRTYQQSLLGAYLLAHSSHLPDFVKRRLGKVIDENVKNDQLRVTYWKICFESIRVISGNVLLL